MIEVEIKGVALSLETAAGLFSPRQADRGTLAMLSLVELAPGMKVLDLGSASQPKATPLLIPLPKARSLV